MGILRKVKDLTKNILPRPLYSKIQRNIIFGFQDAVDTVMGRRPDLIPPKRMIYIGGPEFKKIGDEFFEHFKNLGRIMPDHAILDIGSGIGRMARPFAGFLSPKGSYRGFDIDREGVRWCQDNLTARHPNFNFEYVDIYNKNYNVKGALKASQFRFPYPDNTFDFAFATSVFTHMFPADIENYLRESARVLKPGGRCLFTYFLLNKESGNLMANGLSALDFRYEVDGVLTKDRAVPEDAICLKEDFITGLYEKYGYRIEEPIRFGSWSGRESYLSFQDIILASKI